jgi:hypothetical protein
MVEAASFFMDCLAVARQSVCTESQCPSFYRPRPWTGRIGAMSKNQRQTPRKPATKFAHLRTKMQQAKTPVKLPRKK